ncbi:MLP-like protein 34 [Prunus yedoensis var. nudiflora]|uniref:MLP-like protein 34 n=1 Tax=Prunus yedoensis var. nudiflora TaxID=2094558 RepID=A0A314ZNE3_PRUYE|nr:MLP-like protein 34 [Prunus yedoensis var. nudiflora]
MHLLPNVSSNKVQGVELHEGDWETAGSVKHWDNIIPWIMWVGGRVGDGMGLRLVGKGWGMGLSWGRNWG